MPQIGWLEILIVVFLAIIIIGPKDFPIMLKKIGSWVGKFKNYFREVQNEISNIENTVEKDISSKKNFSTLTNNKKKDE
jgi:sec-independent protein translocase protein TatB